MKPPPGSTGTTPAAPPRLGWHHATTSRKPTHSNVKGSGLNKPPQNPGLDKQREGHCTRYVARHPLRAAAPVTGRDTRSEGVHCLRIGCTAPHDKHNCGQFLPTYPSGSIRRSHTTSKYLPGSEQEALHPIRRATPDPSRDTRSEGVHCLRIGCAPNHKNKRGICETIADTPPTRRRTAPHAANPHRPSQDRCTGGES